LHRQQYKLLLYDRVVPNLTVQAKAIAVPAVLPVPQHVLRRIGGQSDLIALDVHDGDRDAFAGGQFNNDGFTGTACD
jgi:hypothetical protein